MSIVTCRVFASIPTFVEQFNAERANSVTPRARTLKLALLRNAVEYRLLRNAELLGFRGKWRAIPREVKLPRRVRYLTRHGAPRDRMIVG